MTSNQIVKSIKRIAQENLPDSEVLLFGSQARKEERSDSDYDILIIINTILAPKEKLLVRTNIRKELLKVGIRSDILIQSKSEIEKKKNLPGHIVKGILKEAVVL